MPLLRAVVLAASILVLNDEMPGLSRDLATRAGADDIVFVQALTDELVASI